MKILLLITILGFSAFGQNIAIKTTLLETLKKQKVEKQEKLKQLEIKYSEDYPAVKTLKRELNDVDKKIQNILLTDPKAEITPDILPDDQIFLLKLIIIQNQQIIKLLAK